MGVSSISEFSLSRVGILDVVAPGGASGGGMSRGGSRGEDGRTGRAGRGGLLVSFQSPKVSSSSGSGVSSGWDVR